MATSEVSLHALLLVLLVLARAEHSTAMMGSGLGDRGWSQQKSYIEVFRLLLWISLNVCWPWGWMRKKASQSPTSVTNDPRYWTQFRHFPPVKFLLHLRDCIGIVIHVPCTESLCAPGSVAVSGFRDCASVAIKTLLQRISFGRTTLIGWCKHVGTRCRTIVQEWYQLTNAIWTDFSNSGFGLWDSLWRRLQQRLLQSHYNIQQVNTSLASSCYAFVRACNVVWYGTHCLFSDLKQRLVRLKDLLHFVMKAQRYKFNQVNFRFALLMIIALVLCTQLCMKMIFKSKSRLNSSSGMVLVLTITICSLHSTRAHLSQDTLPLSTASEDASRNNQLHQRAAVGGEDPVLTLRLIGGPNVGYCVTIAIGSMPQELCFLVDTGSANTAVTGSSQDGVAKWFDQTSTNTYVDLQRSISVTYTSGEWTGTLSKDQLSLGNTAPFEAYFALIESSDNFYIDQATWVGILGMGYSSLVKPDSSIPTVWDTFRSHMGMRDHFSLQLCPPTDVLVTGASILQGGWMVLGAVNNTMYEGQLFNTSIVKERFYNVLITNLTVGGLVIEMDCTEFNNDKAIIDSGTTDIFLPIAVYEQVEAAFKEHFIGDCPLEVPETFWHGDSKLMWQAQHKDEIYHSFPTFHIGFSCDTNSSEGFSLAITPQTYLRQISGTSAEIAAANITCSPCDFFTFGIKPRAQGAVIGSNVMLGFYTVFDREDRKIGFAPSKCSYKSGDIVSYIEGPYPRDPVDCSYREHEPNWELMTYVCAGVAVPMALVTIILTCTKRCLSRRSHCIRKNYKKLQRVRQEEPESDDDDAELNSVELHTPEQETTPYIPSLSAGLMLSSSSSPIPFTPVQDTKEETVKCPIATHHLTRKSVTFAPIPLNDLVNIPCNGPSPLDEGIAIGTDDKEETTSLLHVCSTPNDSTPDGSPTYNSNIHQSQEDEGYDSLRLKTAIAVCINQKTAVCMETTSANNCASMVLRETSYNTA